MAVAMIGTAAALIAGLTACTSNSSSGSSGSSAPANTKVGVLLPDMASSPRWVSADPTEIKKQCTMYKLTCYVDNANNSATTQQSQAQALINAGVGVLLVVNLDSGSGKAIETLAQQHSRPLAARTPLAAPCEHYGPPRPRRAWPPRPNRPARR